LQDVQDVLKAKKEMIAADKMEKATVRKAGKIKWVKPLWGPLASVKSGK